MSTEEKEEKMDEREELETEAIQKKYQNSESKEQEVYQSLITHY